MDDWIVARVAALERRVTELESELKKLSKPGQQPTTGRSMRMAEGWQPRDETLAWAEEKFPNVEETREREKFVNYWRSRGEPRRDWDAAYRNWILKADEFGPPRSTRPGVGSSSRTTTINQTNRQRIDSALAAIAKRRE